MGDTSVVDFKTVKPCFATRKSHINLVAADTKGGWEQAAAFALEASDAVLAYARNERLEFSIPFEHRGIPRAYFPDFLVQVAERLEDRTEQPIPARDLALGAAGNAAYGAACALASP